MQEVACEKGRGETNRGLRGSTGKGITWRCEWENGQEEEDSKQLHQTMDV